MTRPNLLVVTEPAGRCGCHKVEHERDALAAHIEQAHQLYLQMALVEAKEDPVSGRLFHPIEPALKAGWDEWYQAAPIKYLSAVRKAERIRIAEQISSYLKHSAKVRRVPNDDIKGVAEDDVNDLLYRIINDVILEGE